MAIPHGWKCRVELLGSTRIIEKNDLWDLEPEAICRRPSEASVKQVWWLCVYEPSSLSSGWAAEKALIFVPFPRSSPELPFHEGRVGRQIQSQRTHAGLAHPIPAGEPSRT